MDVPATNPSHVSSQTSANHRNGWPCIGSPPRVGPTQGLSGELSPSLESLSLSSPALLSPCSHQPSLPPQNYKPQHPPSLPPQNYRPQHPLPSTLPLQNYKPQHPLPSTLPLQNYKPQHPPSLPPQNYRPQHSLPSTLPIQKYRPQHPLPSTLPLPNYALPVQNHKPLDPLLSTLPLENYNPQHPPQSHHGHNYSLSSSLPVQNTITQDPLPSTLPLDNHTPQVPHHAAPPPPPHPSQTQGPCWSTDLPRFGAPILDCPPSSSTLCGGDWFQQQQAQWIDQPCAPAVYQPVATAVACPYRGPPPEGSTHGALSSPSSPQCRYGLDPALLPSAVLVMEEDQAEWEGRVFVSEPQAGLPPLATTHCTIQDQGSASPCAVRVTSYVLPCEGQSALLSHLPLGALLTPLTPLSLPEVSEAECVRGCGECGALMCPSMEWQDCGRRFTCPFCGQLNEGPWQQHQFTDREENPELCCGSYQILHTLKEDVAVVLLALDVSAAALSAGHLNIITQQIHTLLREEGAVQSDVRVGLMTYDSRLHLYDLSPSLSRPHMLVVTEMEELELPVRDGLLVPLKDCVDSLESVLQQIPLFSADWDVVQGVPMEMPVAAGLAVLKALGCPGKLLIFHTTPLTEAPHTPHSSGLFSSNKPKSLFQPPDSAVSLAKQCVSQGCGVHVFLLSKQNVGGAWAGHIPYLTGGTLRCYDNLQRRELERQRLSADLRKTVTSEMFFKALVRIHLSKDLRVSGCYGAFTPGPSPSQVALATLDEHTTLAVEMTHNKALEETRGASIQVAVSYSTQTGHRRTRVHSVMLRCSRHLLDTFRHCQAQTLLAFYCKKMYCSVLERPLQELREELQSELTEALACYRKHCSTSSVSKGQLVMPRPLKALPVYVNSLRKSEVLLPGLHSSVHQRLLLRCQLLSMETRATATHFYPTLLPLPAAVPLPACGGAVRCRAASLEPHGVYLLHGPLVLLLCLGSNVSSDTLVLLFNSPSLSALTSGETQLPVLDNPLSVRVRGLVSSLNLQTPYTRKMWLVKQGDGCDEALQRLLVEDRSPNGGASYSDFLYHLHVNSVRLMH